MWIRPSTGVAIITVATAVTATSARARIAARTATRPSAPDEASDPTLATSIDATSGITVMRIRLMKIVPTGVRMVRSAAATVDEPAPASARPRRNPATNPSSTRVVKDTRGWYYGYAGGRAEPLWQAPCIKTRAEGHRDPDTRLPLPGALVLRADDQLHAGRDAQHSARGRDCAVSRAHHPRPIDRQRLSAKEQMQRR